MTEQSDINPVDASSASTHKKRPQFSFIRVLTVVAIVVIPMWFLLLPVRRGREPARRVQCKNNLRQIALALRNYESAYNTLPPAHTVDADGKPLHSWRTLILPYLDQQKLYEKIDLSKPWNDPANAEAYNYPVYAFRCPSTIPPSEQNSTTYMAVVGPDDCFHLDGPRRLSEITRPHGETLMVIEVAPEMAVHWMSPFDADEQIVQGLVGKTNLAHMRGTNAAFVDGSVRYIPKDTPSSQLHDWISITGSRK